jgi:hypothetical protein
MKVTISRNPKPLKLNGFARRNAYMGINKMIENRKDLKSTFMYKLKKMEIFSDQELLKFSTEVAEVVNPQMFRD